MNKLFVGQLPFSVDNAGLKELFSQIGTVISATIISDRETGKSKGFGFVEMSTDEEAQKAITALHGTDVGGRKIVVNIARPREER